MRDREHVEIDYRSYPVLLVDDEPHILRTFALTYDAELTVHTAESAQRGLGILRATDIAVIVADQRMPEMTGTEFLERSMAIRPDAVRIILTGYTDNEALVHAINKSRIYRYLTKPWDSDELDLTLRRAIEVFHLTRENARLLENLRDANERLQAQNAYLKEAAVSAGREIVGGSAPMRHVLGLIQKVGPTDSTVLLEGETGTGKELAARAIHGASLRRDGLFVAVNCAEFSESVLESELFGHRRGAFTGAAADRQGLIEVAHGGTLFLDEVAETTAAFQAKLLRVLEDGHIRRIGDNLPRRVDVRVIAATNRRLEQEVKAGRFREDLYYRLRVFPIRMPPLRDRREDIPDLAAHLTRRLATRLKKPVGDPTPETVEALLRYHFPGNVRELANEIERAILLAEPGAALSEDLLSDELLSSGGEQGRSGILYAQTDAFERDLIKEALTRAGGVKTKAAEDLGLSYRGFTKKLRRLGL